MGGSESKEAKEYEHRVSKLEKAIKKAVAKEEYQKAADLKRELQELHARREAHENPSRQQDSFDHSSVVVIDPSQVASPAATPHHCVPGDGCPPSPPPAAPAAAEPVDPDDEFLAADYLIANRYKPTKMLAQGGFGKTYMGTDQKTNSKVVVKVLLSQSGGDYSPAEKVAFEKEADKLKRLGEHPNIPGMLEYVELGSKLLLVQECVDGDDLWVECCKNGVVYNEEMLWGFLTQLLKLFDFCHCRANNAGGVIHRDIKPQNIMRRNSDKEFILIDFGAAKSVGGLNPVQHQTAIGTPGYQAPEISQGQVYFGSDLFSLGATMVWLLARVEPSQMQGGSTNWRSYVRTPVSPMMASVLDGLLKFNPAERFQDAAGVIQFIRMHAPQIWDQYNTTAWSSPSLKGVNSQMASQINSQQQQQQQQRRPL